ncbi:MAG: hypothetical protein IK126_01055 [Bacteroidales bacterium]|nr:hypothetical protein [Bacteroidales bacterium]
MPNFFISKEVRFASNAEPVSATAAGSRAAAFPGIRDVSQLELLKLDVDNMPFFIK